VLFANYYKDYQIKAMGWADHVARMKEMINVYKILVGKVKGKCYLGEQYSVEKRVWGLK
jgi:hypothetical protein